MADTRIILFMWAKPYYVFWAPYSMKLAAERYNPNKISKKALVTNVADVSTKNLCPATIPRYSGVHDGLDSTHAGECSSLKAVELNVGGGSSQVSSLGC
jgi:hypothetical protein